MSKMDTPLVSIVTPSFNQGRFIEMTIRSVLEQTYPRVEHIVVDGGSSDQTLGILRHYQGLVPDVLRWISEPDQGQADAVNKGFSMCAGEIVGWLNSDDVYFDSNVLSYVVDVFNGNPTADVVFGNDVLIDPEGKVIRVRRMPEFNYDRLLRLRGGMSQPTVFFRKDVISRHRLKRELQFCLDLEFWLRLGKRYHFYKVDRLLAGNRLHRDRKMIAHHHEALEEILTVCQQYGRSDGLWQKILVYMVDRPSAALWRWSGLRDMAWILWGASSMFVKVPGSKLWCLRNQVVGPAEKLALNAGLKE